jgi:acyl-CoA oxidase
LTYFNRVRLAPTALLGDQLRAKDPRSAFFFNASRVIVGSLSMGAIAVSAMRIATCIAGRYSLRRTVIDTSTEKSRQIGTFSSHYLPLMTAISQFFVSQSFSRKAHQLFVSPSNQTQKHLIAAMFKATVMKHCHDMTRILADRCGAQGMFEVNQIAVMHVSRVA